MAKKTSNVVARRPEYYRRSGFLVAHMPYSEKNFMALFQAGTKSGATVRRFHREGTLTMERVPPDFPLRAGSYRGCIIAEANGNPDDGTRVACWRVRDLIIMIEEDAPRGH